MSFQVLQSLEQVATARKRLDRFGWSYSNSVMRRALWHASRGRYPRVGDYIKSWDVGRTAEFAVEHLARERPILDFGAFGSEMPPLLNAAGFTKVTGIDLNRNVRFMPRSGTIRYVQGDFHACPFEAASFDLITAISVIEHGYAPEKLLGEVSRLLRPGGFFVASFDYWPDKLETNQVKLFDLDWLIFSAGDVNQLIAKANRYGLAPVGTLECAARDRPVSFAGYQYTFGWLALRKPA